MIDYQLAEDVAVRIGDILQKTQMAHIDESRVVCIRSKGTKSRRIIARCHGLPRIMQLALGQEPLYVIEVISERFNKLGREDQTRVLIHELMHIPYSFGGGFRAHRPHVTRRKVESMYRRFQSASCSHRQTRGGRP